MQCNEHNAIATALMHNMMPNAIAQATIWNTMATTSEDFNKIVKIDVIFHDCHNIAQLSHYCRIVAHTGQL